MEGSPSLPTLLPEILVQIFHKLPIKSIHQCKSVCKEWRSLISDPFFKSNYNPLSIPNHPLNLMMIPSPASRKSKLSSLSYEIHTTTSNPLLVGPRPQPLPSHVTSQDRVSVLGSWNGLVALYRHARDFCLFNPYLAGKEIVVQLPVDEDHAHSWSRCILYGLCHDSVNDEYKAVISKSGHYDPQSFYVVSFKDRSLKLKTQNLLSRIGMNVSGTIVKGVPHWVCRDALETSSIFYFDSKTEEFKMAPKVPNGKEIWGLGVLDGRLTASLRSDVGFEVWGLKEHGDGDCCWSMLFVIVNKLRSLSTLLWVIKEVEVLIDVNGEELMVYNVRDRSLRRVQRRMKRSLYNIVAYVPSLISPV